MSRIRRTKPSADIPFNGKVKQGITRARKATVRLISTDQARNLSNCLGVFLRTVNLGSLAETVTEEAIEKWGVNNYTLNQALGESTVSEPVGRLCNILKLASTVMLDEDKPRMFNTPTGRVSRLDEIIEMPLRLHAETARAEAAAELLRQWRNSSNWHPATVSGRHGNRALLQPADTTFSRLLSNTSLRFELDNIPVQTIGDALLTVHSGLDFSELEERVSAMVEPHYLPSLGDNPINSMVESFIALFNNRTEEHTNTLMKGYVLEVCVNIGGMRERIGINGDSELEVYATTTVELCHTQPASGANRDSARVATQVMYEGRQSRLILPWDKDQLSEENYARYLAINFMDQMKHTGFSVLEAVAQLIGVTQGIHVVYGLELPRGNPDHNSWEKRKRRVVRFSSLHLNSDTDKLLRQIDHMLAHQKTKQDTCNNGSWITPEAERLYESISKGDIDQGNLLVQYVLGKYDTSCATQVYIKHLIEERRKQAALDAKYAKYSHAIRKVASVMGTSSKDAADALMRFSESVGNMNIRRS